MHICRRCDGYAPDRRSVGMNRYSLGRLLVGVLVFLVFALVGGCTSRAIYRDDLFNPPVYWGEHVVEPGETLYSIAWRYGRNYRELAAANHIPSPYKISPGEVIHLDRRGHPATVAASPESQSTPPYRARQTPSLNNKQLQTTSPADSDIHWQWPHVGPIIANFSLSGKINKGIDIAGRAGEPVRAAAGGKVVYAGNGLRGYGELIIINHNEHFLSAYAHNSKMLVSEGETVHAGQVIARMGATGARRVELHFEIRINGRPVNPLRFLPKPQ